jgi:transcriptional regulator with XRE-family HTH domain
VNRIRQLREEQDITQSELAALMNTNYQTISDYERGKYSPSIEFYIALAKHFKTSIDYILGETDLRDPYMSAKENFLDPKEMELVRNYRELDAKAKEKLLGIAMGMKEAK